MKKQSVQKGVALVEFALVLPLLLLLTFLVTEFGRAMYEYNALTKVARDAVRYLSVQLPATKINEARNLMVYGKTVPQTGDLPLARGLTLSNVPTDTCCTWQVTGTNPVINTVTVRISGYTFRPLAASVFGVVLAGGNGTIIFSDITATMRAPL